MTSGDAGRNPMTAGSADAPASTPASIASPDAERGPVASALPPGADRKESPERLLLRRTPRPVTRFNRTTLAVLIGGLSILVLIATLWGLRRPPPKPDTAADHEGKVDHAARAEGLDALPRDYASIPRPQPPPRLGAPIGELGRPVIREEQAAGLQPLPERPSFSPNPEEDALRTRRLQEVQEAEAANKSQVIVQLKRSQQTPPSSPPSEAAPGPGTVAGGAPQPPSRAEGAVGPQEHKEGFLTGSASNPDARIYSAATLQTPRSSAQLMAGTIIPAALLTGIDSDLPGMIMASVTSPVYDSVTGRLLLIPQGARLLGQYDSQVAYGQRRVLLVWTRLIMPDGSSILLDRLPGTDTTGQAGLEDQVDWHIERLAGGAALSTVLGVASALATPNRSGSQGVLVIATQQSVQDTANQIGQEITRRNLDVQPTLRIRPGFSLRVIVNKDITLRPYAS